MNYETYSFDKLNVHLIKTNKFNTTTISINFLDKIDKNELLIRRFLFNVLACSSKKYNTTRLFEIELENLYNLCIEEATVKMGNLITSYIDIKYLDKKYTDDNFYKKVIDLIREMLFNPNINNDEFDINTFNYVKHKFEIDINSKQENLNRYAIYKSYELMDPNDPVGYDLYGDIDELNKITPKSLYDYYKKVIVSNQIEIFIVGNPTKDIINSFKDFKIGSKIDINPYITYNDEYKTKGFIEEMDTAQSKLSMLLRINNITLFERKYVLPIYLSILVNSSTSRLFTNVREKNSLAYSISGINNSFNSLIAIYAGINKDNYEKVVKLITDELNLDNLLVDEIDIARKSIFSSLETIFDNPSSIINYYFGIIIFKNDNIDDKINKYNNVTVEDILTFTKKINIAVVYLLKGD